MFIRLIFEILILHLCIIDLYHFELIYFDLSRFSWILKFLLNSCFSIVQLDNSTTPVFSHDFNGKSE